MSGLFLILVIMISGTFAFMQLNQATFNIDFVDVLPGGRIHDIFQGGRVIDGERRQDTFGHRNYNIFAENFGDIPIGVRVQFQEFVSIQNTPLYNINGELMDLHNANTWSRVRFDEHMNRQSVTFIDDNGETPVTREQQGSSAYIGNLGTGIIWQLGHLPNESQMYYMPTFNHINQPVNIQNLIAEYALKGNSVFNRTNAYRFNDTSGRAIDPLAAGWVNSQVNIPVETGENGHLNVVSILNWQDERLAQAIATYDTLSEALSSLHNATDFRGQTGRPQHDGTFDFWQDIEYEYGTRWFINDNGNLGFTQNYRMETRQTLPAATVRVMSMTEWLILEADARRGNFWVHDNYCPEGWFYWVGESEYGSGMIDPKTATSLLLRQTTLPALPRLQYVIRLNAQFFTASNLPSIGTAAPSYQMTANAGLIFGITPAVQPTLAVNPGGLILDYSEGITTATVTVTGTAAGIITVTGVPTGLEATINQETGVITITITDHALAEDIANDRHTITVERNGVEVTFELELGDFSSRL